jgi:hypothetical protein
MLKIFTKSLLISFIILLSVGCGSSNKELEGLNETDYKIVQERLDFERIQKVDMNFDIDKDTDKSLTMLLDSHIKIMYKINLAGVKKTKIKNILYVELNSNKRVQLNKLLLEKKDYYFDSVNNAIYVSVEIPYIYLLDNKFKLDISLSMVTNKRQLVKRDVTMMYETRPMRDNDENYMSFKYEKNFESQDLDSYIRSMIHSELQNANLSAFDKDYKSRHRKLFTGDN